MLFGGYSVPSTTYKYRVRKYLCYTSCQGVFWNSQIVRFERAFPNIQIAPGPEPERTAITGGASGVVKSVDHRRQGPDVDDFYILFLKKYLYDVILVKKK